MSTEITTPTATEPVEDRPVFRPAVDIFENADELLLVADLPGVPSDAIEVDLEEDRLTIFARRKMPLDDASKVLSGFATDWDYRRVFSVPEAVDATKIRAEYDRGVLTLHLPRHERTKPRRISIKAS